MSVPFKPMRGRLLVENIVSSEQTTSSGIILPSSDKPDNKAKVIKAGEGIESLEGQVVSYRDDCGRVVRIGAREYLLIYEGDIDGIYQ